MALLEGVHDGVQGNTRAPDSKHAVFIDTHVGPCVNHGTVHYTRARHRHTLVLSIARQCQIESITIAEVERLEVKHSPNRVELIPLDAVLTVRPVPGLRRAPRAHDRKRSECRGE